MIGYDSNRIKESCRDERLEWMALLISRSLRAWYAQENTPAQVEYQLAGNMLTLHITFDDAERGTSVMLDVSHINTVDDVNRWSVTYMLQIVGG